MLTPEHSALLCALSNYGAAKREFAQYLYEEVCTKSTGSKPTEAQFEKAIEDINSAIARFDQRISNFYFNLKGAKTGPYIVFSVTSESSISLHQQNFHAGEVDFFRELLKAIMESDDQCVTSIQALRIATKIDVKAVSQSRAEELLEKWFESGYLAYVGGKYFLGPRALVEFTTYIRQHYKNKIVSCEICKLAVFWGVNCASCDVDVHADCIQKYLEQVGSCPKCRQEWEARSNE